MYPIFMDQRVVNVGLVGFGIVGTGVAKIILEDGERIAERTGIRLTLARIVDVDTKRPRPVSIPEGMLSNDLDALIRDPKIEIGVELVGGTGSAREIQLALLGSGKDVVTANKALLATHGSELFDAAHRNGRCIAFEASCAGGIPIISSLRTGLAANDIQAIYGIVNGTCNSILSSMTAKGLTFAEALSQAQKKGYAEADPTLDLSGVDSAHKLVILSSIAFGEEIRLGDVHVEGIDAISHDDIRYGTEMGYSLKLLAIGQKNRNGKVSLRVHPSFIDRDCALARVGGPFNAVSVFGHAVGQVNFYGRGAGMMPTASAVVADILEVAMGNSARSFSHARIRPRAEAAGIEKIDDLVSRFYIRVMAKDEPGVLACLSKVLGDHRISISGALQHEGRGPDNSVPIVIATHATSERSMYAARKELSGLDVLSGEPVCIRIVDIPEDRDG
jgi:homoserine dehydrogenase